MKKYISTPVEYLNLISENKIYPPEIPNTLNFWHGGNLDDYDELISQKSGRYEYGTGLYLTTHYETAKKYAKGNRKLYLVTVEKGTDLNDVSLDLDKIVGFLDVNVSKSKKKEVLNRIEKFTKDGKIKADIFNNVMINTDALKSSNSIQHRKFLIKNGIDYQIVKNPFGWGENMMVLYNMNKIKNKIVVKPKDDIMVFDLK